MYLIIHGKSTFKVNKGIKYSTGIAMEQSIRIKVWEDKEFKALALFIPYAKQVKNSGYFCAKV